MKNPNYNTLAFIRYYFHIPENCRLSWALIEETVDGETEIRLGVVFLERPCTRLAVRLQGTRSYIPPGTG